jgi:hypothetical protein
VEEHEKSAEEEMPVMLRLWVLVLGCWCIGGEGAGAQSGEARRVISCEGPFAPTTTPEVLAAAFGAANVTTEDINLGEGQFEEGTVLFSKSADERLVILWTGGITHGRPRTLSIRGEKSRWRTSGGLTLGASLQAVERLNRRPFRLVGFRWDYGGTTMNWSGGLLAWRVDDPCRIHARFAPLQNAAGEFAPGAEKLLAQVSGERQFSSGHPAVQALNPVVHEIFVQYQN